MAVEAPPVHASSAPPVTPVTTPAPPVTATAPVTTPVTAPVTTPPVEAPKTETAKADPVGLWADAPKTDAAKVEAKTEPVKTDAKVETHAEPVYEIKAPEWIEKATDPAIKASFDANRAQFIDTVKALKIAPEQASAFFQKQMDAQIAAYNESFKTNLAACKADPDFGGAKFDESLANAKRALVALAGVKDRARIETKPEGQDPTLFRILARAGAMMREDGHIGGQAPVAGPVDPVKTLYPGDGRGPKRS